MATSRFSPAQSVATQIRQKSLGVMSGGTQGRSTATHKGVGLNQNKGGLNTKGSARTSVRPVAKPITTTKAGTDPYRYVTRNGQKVLVRWSKMTAAERGLYGNSLANKARPAASQPGVSAPHRPATAPAPQRSTAYLPSGPLDYSNLMSYKHGMADLSFDLGERRADLNTELADAKRLYDMETSDVKREAPRALDALEDDLSRANLLRSGKRETAEADQFREFDRYLAEIEEQYGSGAMRRVQDALGELDRYETLEKRKIEDAARAEHQGWEAERIALEQQAAAQQQATQQQQQQQQQSARSTGQSPRPQGPAPVSPVAKGTPAPKYANGFSGDMFDGQYLYSWNPKTKRNDTVSIDRLSQADVLRLMQRDINQKQLAGGYYYSNGHIYKR